MSKKDNLLKAIAPVNRGIQITEVQKIAIFSAVAYLEEMNPTPKPTEAAELLTGDWQLLFTTSKDLLGFDRLPFVKLGQIYQCVRAAEGKIYNVAELMSLPLLEGLVSVCASFTVVSDLRVKVNFERFVIGSQRLIGYRNISDFVEILASGQKLRAIDSKIKNREQRGWLETTYLDDDLRIGRGNEGSLFVLRKVKRLSFL
ncbi:PAP/fibrillin family protein [Tumidithrix elongata RA019]|uniref:PAP/fibrillin family protein n=1 Tax=Tumidithrix elongata BACA0141 TaxID=2716417 RepID=A0AAW9Q4K7_9CYAN|nr:PAP/fibrillin family protein [Tumidithrix elongata RA019]